MPLLLLLVVLLMLLASRPALAFVGGQRTTIELASIGGGHELRKDAAQAYNAMAAAALKAGVALHVNSAFRTWEQQDALYKLYVAGQGNLASPPGWGNHQAGIAADIESAGGTNAAYRWLVANAGAFRFVNTGADFSQKEPWHWEFQ